MKPEILYLQLGFREQLEIGLTDQEPNEVICLNSVDYVDEGSGTWTGFYDWLRTDHNTIIGVRFWPFPELAAILDGLSNTPYVIVAEHNFEIYFTQRTEHETSKSNDQEFIYSRVYRSSDGSWAVVFGLYELSTTEMESVTRITGGIA